MSNELFAAPLRELYEYGEIRGLLGSRDGIISLTGCLEGQKAHVISGLSQGAKVTVIVTENELSAGKLIENMKFYEPDIMFYPARDLLFFEADVASNLIDQQRMSVMRAISEGGRVCVAIPAQALMEYVTKRASLKGETLEFAIGEEHDFEDIRHGLTAMGYERCAEVMMPGQFSIRGDIVDVWPLASDDPVRIEFFGDEVDAMRYFDPYSQRSVGETDSVRIYPAKDTGGETEPLIDWLDDGETIFFIDEPGRVSEAAEAAFKEFTVSFQRRAELGTGDLEEMGEILSADALKAKLSQTGAVALSMMEIRKEGWKIAAVYGMTVTSSGNFNNSMEMLSAELKRLVRKGYRTVVLSDSHRRAGRLAEGLTEHGVSAFYTEDKESALKDGQVAVMYGHVSAGFEYPMIRFAVISESDIFGEQRTKKKKRKKSGDGNRITSFMELSVGDYVIHESHGLGIYRGIEQVEFEGALRDYIKLEYNGSNLYILATQLELLQKYSGGGEDGPKPRLSKIGGQEWNRTRARVKAAVKDIAKELVELYALRETEQGFVYGPDTVWQAEFEELFPFEETEDQAAAIEDTKRDMESGKIMDRLICGDVGYGKTEVALRAAFKAAMDGKQVAYLVPTTILAQQHYNTFTQRMKDFPIRVDLMCRFRTPSQISKTIADLRKGQVDIVIGTHRLLSKDVEFKDLGLLVIDEEQRFGVTHKEKIKEMRKDVDVLTLTATPIPRTLHMSLAGIRDMSILSEPPLDRTPIQTYVMEYNEEMVREAICRELARNGQVYYVYNRVTDIADVTERIQKLVPEANVAYAHGQMRERELENIMVDFINGGIDVLISTTIIETGLDISNANTMIIHDADRMGLAQLYQLRGRVGRSSRTAYCFLMYRRDKLLSEVAEKRLSAIREFTELGSGIRIAMRDLEIRGSGNLLGSEQSGQMDAIGYDLYCKILHQAVKEVKGEVTEEEFETVVDLSMDAFIPDTYITNEFQKLEFYKKIAGIMNDQDYEDISDELMDRYGPLPAPVKNLLRIANLKASAHRASFTEIKERAGSLTIRVLDKPTFDTAQLPKIIGSMAGAVTIHSSPKGTYFLYHGPMTPVEMTNKLKTFADALASTVKKE